MSAKAVQSDKNAEKPSPYIQENFEAVKLRRASEQYMDNIIDNDGINPEPLKERIEDKQHEKQAKADEIDLKLKGIGDKTKSGK
ncbi:unnamed protein product [Gordionus sp. m RMFG-2023]